MTGMDPTAASLVALTSKLSFPRRTGTPGNTKAREIITSELKARGYDPMMESFWYVPRRIQVPNLILHACLIAATFGIFAAIWFGVGDHPWMVPLLAICLLASLFVQYSMPLRWRMRGTVDGSAPRPRGARQGINIVARHGRPSRCQDATSVLVLGAHHDSVSLAYSPALNLFIFLSNTAGVLACGVMSLVDGILRVIASPANPWFQLIVALSGLATCCTLVARLLNTRSNKSAGAVDNATGCAVLLELAGALNQMPECGNSAEIRFVFFDAEEDGLWGSCFHATKLEHELLEGTKRRSCFISIDEAGGKGPLVTSGSFGFPAITRSRHDPQLDALVASLLRDRKKSVSAWMPYPASDHAPFVEIGVPSVWLSHACTAANTSRDVMEGVSVAHMADLYHALVEFTKIERKNARAA